MEAVNWLVEKQNTPYGHDKSTLIDLHGNIYAWKRYIDEMRKRGTWGDQLTLMAISAKYRTPIILFTNNPGNKIMKIQVEDDSLAPLPPRDKHPLILGYWQNVHYVGSEDIRSQKG
jgi:hypothetical protein